MKRLFILIFVLMLALPGQAARLQLGLSPSGVGPPGPDNYLFINDVDKLLINDNDFLVMK